MIMIMISAGGLQVVVGNKQNVEGEHDCSEKAIVTGIDLKTSCAQESCYLPFSEGLNARCEKHGFQQKNLSRFMRH